VEFDTVEQSKQEADTVIILSSELIAEVMEVHFNKVMFKKKVKIVDLQPTETGYMFSVAFVEDKMVNFGIEEGYKQNGQDVQKNKRDKKGKFVKAVAM